MTKAERIQAIERIVDKVLSTYQIHGAEHFRDTLATAIEEAIGVDVDEASEIIYKWSHGSRYTTICKRQKEYCDDCLDLAKAISTNKEVIKIC